MSDMTTVHGGKFTVEDITHKPRRSQADNLRAAGKIADNNSSVENTTHSVVPQSPTVEGAIKFFEENANGEFKALYMNTAEWLRKYLTFKVKQLPKNLQAVLPDDTKEVVASETSETIKTEQ